MSCEKSENSYEIGISNVLQRETFFKDLNCKSDFYYHILITSDTLFVDGKLQNEFGNYKGVLTNTEIENFSQLINNIKGKERKEKTLNPTKGMTALIIKENGKTIDSLVNFRTEWNKTDLDLFNYVGKLICEKNLIKIKDTINYPTWEMIKPPE